MCWDSFCSQDVTIHKCTHIRCRHQWSVEAAKVVLVVVVVGGGVLLELLVQHGIGLSVMRGADCVVQLLARRHRLHVLHLIILDAHGHHRQMQGNMNGYVYYCTMLSHGISPKDVA